jgi:hypothetical protein
MQKGGVGPHWTVVPPKKKELCKNLWTRSTLVEILPRVILSHKLNILFKIKLNIKDRFHFQ